MTEETTRLHITPLTPDILPSVLPASLRSSATDISFHSIPTFPENSYGYITLPTAEAEKIRKKFNGSILKGRKFRVEMARPQKRHRDEEDAAVAESADGKKKEKKSKKRKAEEKVLDGYELPSDRKVKRGWTEASNAKKEKRKSEKKKGKDDKKAKPQPKSKYTEKPECLFRTEVPPNRKSTEAVDDKKAKKMKKSARESVVHEFEKTVAHPSFLRSKEEGTAPTATFEEGKGWVDATGNVKEPASGKIRKDNFRPGQVPGAKEKRPGKKSSSKEKVKSPEPSSESEDWTSSSGSSDESSESHSESSSSDDESAASVDEEASAQPAPSKEASGSVNDTAVPSDDPDSEMADEDARHDSESSKEVHPLEALFKRPAPKTAEEEPLPDNNAGFSFFGNDDIESEDESQLTGPQTPFTPFTKRDLQTRGLRSAAPTPDTAMVNRHMKWDEFDGADEDVSIDTPVTKSRGAEDTPKEDTEFAKWFWEHRGENNRAWKKRRRDAAKEQRQRDNRKKGLKGKS